MRRLSIAAGLFAMVAAVAAPALAQDYDADTTYGNLELQAGFTPDPALVTLQAGGTIDASTRFNTCQGFIAQSPDVRLVWSGSSKGGSPIKISVVSNADTTLVVNAPDGSWHCDDDSGEDSNPSLTLTPQNGRYEIWVGTYSSGETKNSVLSVSEVTSF
ncbi:peptidase S1 [Brevundimonas goettingensis]|uniref:Peptidase S1 n=1 Tax=Brevundimonas goettingensis TaxID=2774190 RepID=A0A975BZD0_9CAUL|nr:peptidase S1 [Brevundimonas goettingensis]QTC90380.1 peptidase S1 [Brevundimonas goettingensis]